jgi:hypothetical protein
VKGYLIMEEKKFVRNCVICDCELWYTTKREMVKAEKNKTACMKCSNI